MADDDVMPCCDPAGREKAGRHAATCKDPWGFYEDREIGLAVACPLPRGCGRPAGQGCVTAQGYSSAAHRVRIVVARGGRPAPVKKDSRPSRAQADMLAAAVAGGGIYLLCGYSFHGVDRLRRSMKAMVDKDWFEFREALQAEDRYEITNGGRNALARYQEWMGGIR